MKIACEQCGTAYDVDEVQIPSTGMSMKCTVCFHSFTVSPPSAGSPPSAVLPPSAGIALDLPNGQGDFQLSNDPTDIPLAPAGYVDPTTMGLQGSGIVGLPGLPPPPAGGGLSDLPGLPSGGGQQFADLPGLARPAPGLDLPGLPSAQPAVQPPGLTDLPGLLPRPQASPPPPLPGGGGLPPPPGPPSPGGPVSTPPPPPASPPSGGLPELSDLPGLPIGGTPGAELPGLAQQQEPQLPGLRQGALPELSDLPAPTSEARGAGLSYGEMAFDSGDADLSLELEGSSTPPLDGIGLPAPVGGVGLPAPATGGFDLPAGGGIGLPAPAGGIDLPAPAGGIDLPAPAGGIDLPAPAGGIDLPAPAGGIDLPAPAGGIDLPAPAGGIDLPTPAEGNLPGGVIDLPGPAGTTTPDIDVVAPKAQDEEIIRFEAPVGGPVVEAVEQEQEAEVEDDAPVDIRERGRLPSKSVLIAGGAGLALLIGGIIAAVLIFGGSKGLSPQERAMRRGRKLLRLDTYVAYRDAAEAFANAAKQMEGDKKLVPIALQATALAARSARYTPGKSAKARRLLEPFANLEKPPPELVLARALLALARGQLERSEKQLAAASNAAPQDARASFYLGLAHQARRHYGKAKTAFKRALAADAKQPGAAFGLAFIAHSTHATKQALAYVKTALADSPAHGEALLLLADLQLLAGQTDAAKKTIARAARLAKGKKLARPARSLLFVCRGRLAEARGEPDKARTFYQSAMKFDSQNVEARILAGKLQFAARRFQEASDHFRAAQVIAPHDVETSILLAKTLLLLDKPADARDALMVILKRAPKNAPIRLMLGRIEESVRAYDTAAKQYQTAIKLQPKLFAGYHSLARLQIKQRKPRQSFATLQEAAKVLPHDARVINAIGEVHMALRELPAARKKFEQALAIDAKLDLALFNLASVFRAQKKLKQALAKYLELKARNDAFPGLHAGLGGVYVDLGQGKEAAAAYDKALLTVLPKDVALRLAAGRGYILVRAWEKALHQANQVLLIDSTIADARALRAEARTIENDYGEALVEIQRAISRRKKSRYFVIYARILERLRRLADAVEAYRQALKLAPKRIDLRLHRARLQVRGGAVKDAIKELKRIVREKPKLAEAHLFMGIALADLGKEAKAKAAYQRALVYKPGLGEAHFKLGQIYYDANDNSAAFKHLQAANRAASKAASKDARWWSNALFLLAQVAERLKKKPAAIAAYKQVVKIASAGDSNRTLAIKALKRLGAWINPDD